MLGEFSLPHILIVLLVIILVFGVKRLPEIGSSMGKGIREFRKSIGEIGQPSSLERNRQAPTPEVKGPKKLSQ